MLLDDEETVRELDADADDAEALIREARRRARRRRMRAVAVVVLAGAAVGYLAAGGGGGSAATHPGGGGGAPGRAGAPRASGRAAVAVSRLISSLQTITLVSPRVGYGLIAHAGGPCTLAVASTADGGASFAAPVDVASWRCANEPPASRLAFDGRGDGFLYGPELYVTHDGGRSWSAVPAAGTVLAVSAVGRSAWMLEGSCPAGTVDFGAPVCPLRLLESGDGGRRWAPAPAQPPGALTTRGALTLEAAQGQNWLVRAGARAAYVLTSPPLTPGHAVTSVPLWRTDDGGATWTREQIPCRETQSAMLAAAPGGRTLLAVCAGEPSAGFQAKSTATSADGGRSWSLGAPCWDLNLRRCAAARINQGYLGAVVALSPRTAYVTGLRSELLVAHRGGTRWSDVAALGDFDGDGSPDAIVFADARHGLALGDDTLWRTADGGASWTKIAAVRS